MQVRILCMGNELVGDDGVGIRVGRILLDLPMPEGVVVELSPRIGIELIDALRAGELLVLVDACCTGQPPGTCRTMQMDEIRVPGGGITSHTMGVADVLDVARRIAPDRMPREVVAVVVEAAVVDRFTAELSDLVREAIPRAVELACQCAGLPADLATRGVALAETRKGWDPKPAEAMGG